ncbi:MAG: hypothetical protein HGB35_00110 [Geobacteraceae bacterium]|nr:hypothetical protein [Geobacteraceae bacterium]
MKGTNQSESYRIAFPGSRKWKPDAVTVQASTLLRKPKVAVRYEEMLADRAAANAITVDRVLQEYAKLAFTNLPGIIRFDGVNMMVEDFDKLTPEQRACIQSFKIKTEKVLDYDDQGKPTMTPVSVVEVKLYSKQAALDKLAEFLEIGKSKDDEDDGAPVYIGFQQNIQNNITVVDK